MSPIGMQFSLGKAVVLETAATHLACTGRRAHGRYDGENGSRSMTSAAPHTFAAPGPTVAAPGRIVRHSPGISRNSARTRLNYGFVDRAGRRGRNT